MADPETLHLAGSDLLRHTSFSVVARPQRTESLTLPGGSSIASSGWQFGLRFGDALWVGDLI